MTTPENLGAEILRGIVLVEFGDHITPRMELLGDYIDMFLQTRPVKQYQKILAMFETATEEHARKYSKIYLLQEMLNIRFRKISSE
jgi:hypothetical protein